MSNNININPENIQHYRDHQESVLVQLVLLNRRRADEVQRLFLNVYSNAPSKISQEKIQRTLSTIELNLTDSFFEERGVEKCIYIIYIIYTKIAKAPKFFNKSDRNC